MIGGPRFVRSGAAPPTIHGHPTVDLRSNPTDVESSRLVRVAPEAGHEGRRLSGRRHPRHNGPGRSDLVSEEDLRAELERLKQENERLKGQKARGISLKVSEKGALSVYGLGRFPVTLYKEQWKKLLDVSDDIRAFLAENDDKLKTKS
jgi:hypothetical protein